MYDAVVFIMRRWRRQSRFLPCIFRNQKNERLEALLQQTDQCLSTLAARIKLPKPKQQTAASTADMRPDGCLTNDKGDGSASGQVLNSTSEWSRLAESLTADIAQQPELLVGGRLRAYQMQVLATTT